MKPCARCQKQIKPHEQYGPDYQHPFCWNCWQTEQKETAENEDEVKRLRSDISSAEDELESLQTEICGLEAELDNLRYALRKAELKHAELIKVEKQKTQLFQLA